jgi:hypothetical protein
LHKSPLFSFLRLRTPGIRCPGVDVFLNQAGICSKGWNKEGKVVESGGKWRDFPGKRGSGHVHGRMAAYAG